MPFTVSPGSYQGGQFLFQGLSNLGAGIGKGLDELEQAKKDAAGGEIILNIARQQGILDPETEAKYHNGGLSQKNGIIANLVKGFALTTQQQQIAASQQLMQERQQQMQQARALATRQEAEFGYEPTAEQLQQAEQLGGKLIKTGPGKYHFQPYEDSGGVGGQPFDPTKATRVKDIESGEDLPYYSLRTGPKQAQVLGVPDASAAVRLNPETKLWERWTGKVYEAYPAALQQDIWRKELLKQQGGGGSTTDQAAEAIAKTKAAPAPSGTPPTVKSVEEANKLPPGTLYYTPDGKLKRR